MMFDLGYAKPEEVPQIPRLAKTPVAIAYAPPGGCHIHSGHGSVCVQAAWSNAVE
jgi:hypothetical protein